MNSVKPNAFLSALLAVIAVVLICIFIVLLVIREVGIGHVIRNTDIVGALEAAVDGDGEQSGYILDQINDMPFNEGKIQPKHIDAFLKDDAVTHEIESIIDAYALAFTLGNHDHHITQDDVVRIVTAIEPEVNWLFSHEMTQADIEELAQTLDDIIDFSSLSVDGLMQDFDVDMTVPLLIISPAIIWLVGITSFIILLFIFLLRRKDIVSAAFAVGIPIALAGLIMLAAGAWLNSTPELPGDIINRFSNYLELPIKLLIQYSLTVATIGIVIAATAFIFKAIRARV